jgi:hypothetical protein
MSHIIDDKVFIEAYRALIDTPVVRPSPFAVPDRRSAVKPNRRGFERRVAMCTFIYSGDRRQTRRRTLSGRRAGGSGK